LVVYVFQPNKGRELLLLLVPIEDALALGKNVIALATVQHVVGYIGWVLEGLA